MRFTDKRAQIYIGAVQPYLTVYINGRILYSVARVRESRNCADVRFVIASAVCSERNVARHIHVYVIHSTSAKITRDYTRAYAACAYRPVVTAVKHDAHVLYSTRKSSEKTADRIGRVSCAVDDIYRVPVAVKST